MPTATEQKPTRASQSSTFGASTIGEDLLITGNVSSKNNIHIDGHIQGDVHCASLVLGENSHIEGNVTAEDVTIQGCLIGSVRGLRVTLQSTSHVEGDLLHANLVMEEGAYFEGRSRRSEDPLSTDRTAPKDPAAAEPQLPGRAERRREQIVRELYPIFEWVGRTFQLDICSVGGEPCLRRGKKERLSLKG